MGELGNFAKQQSAFLKLNSGEKIEAVYLGYKIMQSPFDPDKEIVSYKLETEWGVKSWNTGSSYIAQAFDTISLKSRIRILKQGEGQQARYQITLLDGNKVAEEVNEGLKKDKKK